MNQNASDFYNNISDTYDEMFDFENDLKSAEKIIAELKKQFSFKTSLDIGCGTGSFTIALSRSDAKTTGVDLSTSMIDLAKNNSLAYKQNIDFVNSGMTDLINNIDDKFDLIMCMGNTLPHLLTKEDLLTMLSSCKQLLNPGGHLVLNLLNYDRILSSKERIIGITKSGDHEFIRFNDFQEPYVCFNLLEIDWSQKTPLHKITNTRLYPYTHLELESALIQLGFSDLEIQMTNTSKSITIVAKS